MYFIKKIYIIIVSLSKALKNHKKGLNANSIKLSHNSPKKSSNKKYKNIKSVHSKYYIIS